jgi:hypothetical protein
VYIVQAFTQDAYGRTVDWCVVLLPQLHIPLISCSFKEGKVILPNNERIQIVTDKAEKGFYELVIANVLPEDCGKYSCTAKNKYGEVSCEARVTVTSKLILILVAITGEADDSHLSLSLSLSVLTSSWCLHNSPSKGLPYTGWCKKNACF